MMIDGVSSGLVAVSRSGLSLAIMRGGALLEVVVKGSFGEDVNGDEDVTSSSDSEAAVA